VDKWKMEVAEELRPRPGSVSELQPADNGVIAGGQGGQGCKAVGPGKERERGSLRNFLIQFELA